MIWCLSQPNYPWIDLARYDRLALVFNGVGCAIWVVAYAALAYAVYKKRFIEMPAVVAGANIAWEFVWSASYCPTTGKLFWAMYAAAFVVDIFLFRAVLKYGEKQLIGDRLKRLFKPLTVANALLWLVGIYIWESWPRLHDPIGANSGYLINLVLSVTCLVLFLRRNNPQLFSKLIGMTRSLGTGLISVSIVMIYPHSPLLIATAAACLILDSVYVALLFRRHVPWL